MGENMKISVRNLFKVKESEHLSEGIVRVREQGNIICGGDLKIQQGKVFNTLLKTRQHSNDSHGCCDPILYLFWLKY